MLRLKLQYFGDLMRIADSWKRPWCWERLKAGGEGNDRGLDGWMTSLTQWTWVWVNSGSWWWTERSGMLQPMGVGKSQTWLSNWTELNYFTVWCWFLPYIHMNQPWMYMCPSLLKSPPTSLPTPIPLGCPRAPALSALLHVLNLHWSSVLYKAICRLQCYSLIWSHPRLPPCSERVCSLHLCLFCCLAYRVIVTVFLNSIYMC